MKVRRIFTLMLTLVLVLAVPVFANTPESVTTTATININKVLTPSAGDVFPDVDQFQFNLVPVSYTLAETGEIVTDTEYMPTLVGGNTVNVDVTLNGDGTKKEGSSTVNLDFTGKKVGVYTYSLQEVNGGVHDVTYDDSLYYVNVYVVNQLDENGVPTGEVTISAITAWKTNNMSDEALKGLVQDSAGIVPDAEEGKVGKSTDDKPGEISYPFENDYETQADLSLTKVVKGTYASKTQLFDFDVNLVDGLPEAGTYQIEYYNADGTKADGAINENPTTITSGTSIKIKLKHGEKIVIKELPSSATYTITENQLGTYTAEYVANGNETMAPTTATGSAGLGANLTAIGKLSDNGIEDGYLSDEEIVYTNTKELTVPTGVMMSVLPFVCGIALIAGFVVVTSRKRQED